MIHRIQKSSKHHGERVIIVIKNLTLSIKIVLLLCLSCFLSLCSYGLFRYYVTDYCVLIREITGETFDVDEFYQSFQESASDIEIYSNDKNERKKLNELLQKKDKYTCVELYDGDTGEYLTGSFGKIVDETSYMMMPFDILQYYFEQCSYNLFYTREVYFKDSYVLLTVQDLHDLVHIRYYFCVALLASLLIFLLPTLIFIRRKVKYIKCLKEEILVMSQGDLDYPVTIQSHDELSVLATEMDHLRVTLHQNVEQEAQMKQSHHELITTLSHDLRTPLTSLMGYLEILSRKRYQDENQMMNYLQRCIEKVNHIKELSNKTFEYALVFDNHDQVELADISSLEIIDYLEENLEYFVLDGYIVEKSIERKDVMMQINFSMLKRVFNNLCSNIQKYADISQPIIVHLEMKHQQMKITMSNTKNDKTYIDSYQIGLKSVQKVMELHHGKMFVQNLENSFTIVLTIPYLEKRNILND